jgi:hypothetical protein
VEGGNQGGEKKGMILKYMTKGQMEVKQKEKNPVGKAEL